MKKRSIRLAAISIAAVMFLSACTSTGNVVNEDGASGVSIEAIADTSNAENKSGSDTATTFPVTVVNHPVSSSQEGKVLCTGSYPEIVLSDEYKEKYPKLSESINNYNETNCFGTTSNISEYAAWALEDTYNTEGYFDTKTADIVRFDDHLFTIFEISSSFTGGAHPNHYSYATNYDPATGDILRLDKVLDDSSLLSDGIRTELEKTYPRIMEEVDSFYFPEEGQDPDQFVQKLRDDTYTWTIDDKGLNIFFSPYEIASYATGDLQVVLSSKEYPDLVKADYMLDQPQDLASIVNHADADTTEVAPSEDEPDPESASVSNPTWKYYKAEEATVPAGNHLTLTKVKEEKTDYLDTYAWAEANDLQTEMLTHEDDNYFYNGTNEVEYANSFQGIDIYDTEMDTMYYSYDLSELCDGPDYEQEKVSAVHQFIRYATIVDNILYVEIGHLGYASEEPESSYIVAINLETNELIFRSEPLVANGSNFKIVDDTIICGYGFTSEPDYIYLLDRFTGEKYDAIKINSAADQFQVKGDTLYVATYNTAYEFTITH